MLKLTVSPEEYIKIGDDIEIVFVGGSKNNMKILIDAPKKYNIVRSSAMEHNKDSAGNGKKPKKYYADPDLSEKYKKKEKK